MPAPTEAESLGGTCLYLQGCWEDTNGPLNPAGQPGQQSEASSSKARSCLKTKMTTDRGRQLTSISGLYAHTPHMQKLKQDYKVAWNGKQRASKPN